MLRLGKAGLKHSATLLLKASASVEEGLAMTKKNAMRRDCMMRAVVVKDKGLLKLLLLMQI